MFAQISLERHSANTVENFERPVRDAPEILNVMRSRATRISC